MSAMIWKERIGGLELRVYGNRGAMGEAAAADCAAALRSRIASSGSARAIFAAAPSQNELLAGLAAAPGIQWDRVTALHMDEYIGLDAGATQSFALFLKDRLFGRLPLRSAHYLCPDPAAPWEEARRYSALIAEEPIDIVCLGVGENGHVAFNDPPADLKDPLLVREVELDAACRRQQVNDGCFPSLEVVPRRALTLTVPALMGGGRLFCVVPGQSKAAAVKAMLRGPIDGSCPASALRMHPSCILYLDRDSAAGFLSSR